MPATFPHTSFVCVPSVRVVCALLAVSVPVTANPMTPGKSTSAMYVIRAESFMTTSSEGEMTGLESENFSY